MNDKKSQTKTAPAEANGGGCCSRQAFVGAAIGGVGVCWLAATAYPLYRYLASPVERANSAEVITRVKLKDAQKLDPGTSQMFKFGSRPAILIHHADDTWVAMDAVCTHLGCTVQFQAAKNRIFCACHGGVYDAKTGANVSGPPPKPLLKFKVEVVADAVVVSKA